jgi:hypothetical protein
MKRYGDFITPEEDLAFLTTIRKYIDKEVMPVRMELDERPETGFFTPLRWSGNQISNDHLRHH